MFEHFGKTLRLSVCAVALLAMPQLLQAGNPPTVFSPEEAEALLAQSAQIGMQALPVETARKIALVIVDEASRRTDGTLEQVQADQALVQALADGADSDPEIVAIHANLLGIEAGIEKDLIRVLTLAKASSRTLDRLVRDNPDVGGTLMQRALNALHAPPIAGRIQIAVDDFETLLTGDFGLSDAGRAEVQLLLAQAYIKTDRADEAKSLLKAVVQADVPRWSAQAQTLLSEF